ncbi:serine hydrolase [Chryseolinea sp. T2]|uniref:serine hydrolase domain-containing protein n=1 Tax=Chryseolinea sp. T2 TaxID=3129255 RepID=UPI0030768B7D
MKRLFKLLGLIVLVLLVAAIAYAAITAPPIMAGMAAKTMCSCVFVSDRSPQSVRDKELKVFPGLSDASIDIDEKQKTVTARVLWRTSKAIFRKGLGCTLLAERSEDDIRGQKIAVADPPISRQDTIDWPMGDRLSQVSPAIDTVKLHAAITEAFNEDEPDGPKNTDAVLVVYDGQLVAERYASDNDVNKPHMGWSMTKSITNALIGILVKSGKLTLEQPLPFAEWKDDERNAITLNQLLQASSGLEWTESYFVPTSHFHRMFILTDDKAGYAASLPLKEAPGSRFQYSSGTSNILARLIRQTLGDESYYRFPYDSLFYLIGMNHALIEPDASGTFVGSSYSYATGRDWARFGLLYLNDGIWNGRQILPKGWVEYTRTPAPAALRGEYGAQWHLNAGAPDNPSERKFPNLPTDAYWADGFEDQWIVLVPSHKLVVVRLGVSHHGFAIERLVTEVMEAVDDGGGPK